MKRIDFVDMLPMNVTYEREGMIDSLNRAEKYARAFYE